MTLPAGTIDLGVLPRGEQPEVEAPWPVLVRLRQWRRHRSAGRVAAAVVVTVLAVLALAAAGGPVRPRFEPVIAIQATSFAHDQQNLYVIEESEGRLAAYRLEDGSVRWTAPLTGGEEWLQISEEVLLVESARGSSVAATAYDAGSGRRLWTRAGQGFPTTIVGDRFLFLEQLPASSGRPDARLAAVDPRTGRGLWTARTPLEGYSYSAVAYHLVVADGDRLTSFDLATGKRSATIPIAEYADLHVAGTLAFVLERSGDPATMTAYDAVTLAPQWTVSGLDPDRNTWPTACGGLVCLAGEQPPRALDPATGEPVWSADWLVNRPGEHWYMLFEADGQELAGRLLLTDFPTATRGPAAWLIDAGTGEPVLDLAGWRLGGDWTAAPASEPTATPLLVRPAGETMVIGRLRPDLSGVDPLGRIDTLAATDCLALTRQVLCLGLAAEQAPIQVTVWASVDR